VDYFGRENLKELLGHRSEPAVSIFVPTTRITSDWEAERLRFRAALDRADELLAADYEPEQYQGLTDSLRPLVNDQEFWLHQAEGLAVFVSPGLVRLYRLAAEVPQLVVVGPNFHTRPLVRLLQAPDRYWVLALSQNDVRLWEGSATGLEEVDVGGVPTSISEAVGKFMDYQRETFQGRGAGQDRKDWELGAFARKIDAGMQELLDPTSGPVVLAGVEELHSQYRAVSQLKNLADDGIKGNVSNWGADQLHKAAWPIASRSVESRIDSALKLWESAFRLEKAEADVSASARLAVAGRLRLLMTERNRRLWGHFDRNTGEIELVGEGDRDPGNKAIDLIDELAEVVILRGGNALSLTADQMPTQSGVAAVLR
jgi:hypothetical protein